MVRTECACVVWLLHEGRQRDRRKQNPSSIVLSSRIEKSCRIVSAVPNWYIPCMLFRRHCWTSRRHAPLWVLLLGMRQPRVVHVVSEHEHVAGIGIEDVAHHNHLRWKRSLRAPMVFRSMRQLLTRNVSASRVGSAA